MPTATLHAPPYTAAVPVVSPNLRPIAIWLLACCALVFAIVVVGGITRLTRSGLSIVEWKPIAGTLPPLSPADWQEAFSKYRQTPEFALVNHAMSLDEFKFIFWWEWVHRLLGRLVGVVFLLPFVWFAIRGRIAGSIRWKLAAIFVLGGLQGAMGWYMVQSGLVDDPRVSQYRLTAHLGIAVLIFASMLWVALDLLYPRNERGPRNEGDPRNEGGAPIPPSNGLRRAASALVAVVFVMILSGGFVAGIHAGHAYNTFPLMNGHVVPPEIFMLSPAWRNFFENMATVQFDHRAIAWILAISVPALWLASRRYATSTRGRRPMNLLLGMLGIQIALGITTLLLVVPVPLAALHQAGAALLFAAIINARHALSE